MTSTTTEIIDFKILTKDPWTVLLYIYNFTAVLTTIIAFLGFYLILQKSTRESALFVRVLLGSQVIIYISCIYWSFFMQPVILLPFPGGYSLGFLWNFLHVSSHFQFSAFNFLFGSYFATVSASMLVRLRLVARKNYIFDVVQRPTLYRFCSSVLLLFAVYPSILFYLCQTSNRDSVAYVEINYPHLTWIFSIENLKVYKWNIYFHVYIIGLIVGIALASVIFIATVVGIQYEITAQGQQLSSNMRSYHMKTLRNLFLQTSVTGLFCGVAPMMLACCAVVPNDTDTRVVIIIACSTFGGASIASTCSMIGLNETYRSYILKFFASKVHKKENKTTGNSRVSHVFLV